MKGADVNAQGGYYGNALKAALASRRKQTVVMLLTKGVNFESANLDERELRQCQWVLKRETNPEQADLFKTLQKVQELLERAIVDAEDG